MVVASLLGSQNRLSMSTLVLAEDMAQTHAQPLRRLYKLKARADARLAAAAAEAEHPRDPLTGRPFFVPATGRPPAHDRNRAGVPIGEYLYRKQCARALSGFRIRTHAGVRRREPVS